MSVHARSYVNSSWPGQLPPIGSFCHVNTQSDVVLVYVKQHPFNHHKRLTHEEDMGWRGGGGWGSGAHQAIQQVAGGRKREVVQIFFLQNN